MLVVMNPFNNEPTECDELPELRTYLIRNAQTMGFL